jgi:hypothetical protein
MNINIEYSQAALRAIRGEAKKAGVKIPKRLTALKCSVGNWWLVEGDGGYRKEVCADNAYDAKEKVIGQLMGVA